MQMHPQLDDNGKPVPIHCPSSPTGPGAWGEIQSCVTVIPNGFVPEALNQIPFAKIQAADVLDAMGVDSPIAEPEFAPNHLGMASGVVAVEADGRIWVVSPTNRFGSYKNTFPKGHISPGLSLQQNAVKEAFEETGLWVEILSHLVDVERTTTYNRYYLGRRIGGDPSQMGWESQAVHLAPLTALFEMLESPYDKLVLEALEQALQSG